MTVGYTTGSQWVAGFTGQGFSNTVQAGLYGGYAQGPVYLDGIAGYAYSANQLARSIRSPAWRPRIATGPDRRQPVLRPARRRLPCRSRRPGGSLRDAVRPPAGLHRHPGRLHRDRRAVAQPHSRAQTTNSLRTVLGAQLGGALDARWREKLDAQFRLGWSHEYRRHVAAGDRLLRRRAVGAVHDLRCGAAARRCRDRPRRQHRHRRGDLLYLRYEGDISGQDTSHALTAGVRMTW